MPSPHPRIGLVVDQEMSEALAAFEGSLDEELPRAGLVRRAIFDGVAFQAIVRRISAAEPLGDLRSLMETAQLPEAVRSAVLRELDHATVEDAKRERRRRLLELLRTPDPYGLTALHVSDTIDAFDDPLE